MHAPFWHTISLLATTVLLTAGAAVDADEPSPPTQIETDILIIGGTEAGWAAAIQAARMGVESIIIVHDGEWLGGQFTEQALACVDENKGVGKVGWGVDWHPMKRSFHRSGLFLELMDRIETLNTEKYGSPMPGKPYHGPSTFRPAEAEAIFRRMLQPWIDAGQVQLITSHYPVSANVDHSGPRPKLTGVNFARLQALTPQVPAPDGQRAAEHATLRIAAKITIDASDWGEGIQLSGAAYECGPDPKSRYDEPSAPDDLSNNPPNEMNPITWAIIVEQADETSPVAKPRRYDDRNFVRTTQLSLSELRDLAWDRPVRLGSIPHWPDAGEESPRQLSVFNVRRLVDGTTAKTGRTVILLNYMLGQDYPLERLPQHVVDALEASEPGASAKNIVEMTRTQRQLIFDDAKRHALSVLYHLQTFVHDRADDTTNSFRNFHLSDEFGTSDRLPPKPYIRESLRLKSMYMMREQDGRNVDGRTKAAARERFAQVIYPDGVFCWQFHYDFHRTGRAYLLDSGDGKPWGPSGPWIDFEKPDRHTSYMSDRSVFPLRSLIPIEMDGLLGAQKNVGYSSIVCAAIRLHDQCIAIGQASGAAAAVALRHDVPARDIPFDRGLLEAVRHGLCGEVADAEPLLLFPWRDLAPTDRSFVAINRMAAMGLLPVEPISVDFESRQPATAAWRARVTSLIRATFPTASIPTGREVANVDRGLFCEYAWQQIGSAPLRPWPEKGPGDADGDGIPDENDPTPFTPGAPVVWAITAPNANEDGLPDAPVPATGQTINFTTRDAQPLPGVTNDTGLAWNDKRGYGWTTDNSLNSRRRNIFPEELRDTFAFTRDTARWEHVLANGRWTITVCVGDAGHDQPGQRLSIEGELLFADQSTASGRFHEASTAVTVRDGRLTIDLGPQAPGCNTCLNWIHIAPRVDPRPQ